MIDGKNCKNSIIPRDYERIERTVVDLYKSLNIRSVRLTRTTLLSNADINSCLFPV